jgi:hypothetical protein
MYLLIFLKYAKMNTDELELNEECVIYVNFVKEVSSILDGINKIKEVKLKQI